MKPLEKAEGGHTDLLEAESLVVDMKTKTELPRRVNGACAVRRGLGARESWRNEEPGHLSASNATGVWGWGSLS